MAFKRQFYNIIDFGGRALSTLRSNLLRRTGYAGRSPIIGSLVTQPMSHAIGLIKFMRTIRKHLSFGLLSSLLLCFPATADTTHIPLPADVIMNKGEGRGDWLIVKVRLESGEESPF